MFLATIFYIQCSKVDLQVQFSLNLYSIKNQNEYSVRKTREDWDEIRVRYTHQSMAPWSMNAVYCRNELGSELILTISIYHTSEQYSLCTLIGQLGGDQPSTIHLQAAEGKQNGFCQYKFNTNKVTLCAASYSACMVYTKTINNYSPKWR